MRTLISLFFLLCAPLIGAQSLKLPPTFASGMVLQQSEDVVIWGWADSGKKVSVSTGWDNCSYSTTATKKGRWSLAIKTPLASFDPQSIKISSGKEKLELNDVLIGDVWFVGGQSNMQMNFRGNPDEPIYNAQEILLRSKLNGIRLFRVEQGYSVVDSDTITINGSWSYSNPQTVLDFSAIGFVFGEKLHNILDIPIGLVQSAHGGSTAEAWMDRETLTEYGGFTFVSKIEDSVWYSLLPVVLYNKMIAPLLPMSIKGVIWYQGESNADRPKQYETLFPLMINSWRKYFNNEDMPFYYVQITPCEYQNGINSAELREAQLKVMQSQDNVGMAVALDVGGSYSIHPPQKEVLGERLAYWALNKNYGYTAFGCRGPEFKSMEVKDSKATLMFDYAPNGLSFYGKTPTGFEIAGEDRVFYPAEVRIAPAFWGNEGIQIWSDKVKTPIAVRYGYTNYVDGCLYNTQGLPASSFRTDNWK